LVPTAPWVSSSWFCTSTRMISAAAMVDSAKYGPLSRKVMLPMISAPMAASTVPRITPSQGFHPMRSVERVIA